MSQGRARLMSFARTLATRAKRCASVASRSRALGQDLVEYGVVIAVVAVAVLVAVQTFGTGIAAFFTRLLGHFSGLG